MSLIENALDKLRRSAAAVPRTEMLAPRVAGGTHPLPVLEAPAKRIKIDPAELHTAGFVPEEDQKRRFADYYRQIKRPLVEQALAPDAADDMRLILVTSALAGDGKTFTSVNLAFSMARERDIAVLLVDADVPKAHISRVFGVHKEPGLLDALIDETLDVESLIIRTDVRGLDLLPAGRAVDDATELLASARMAQLASRIAARDPRRLALLDSPPVLASSEAHALLRVPGQIVLVARAGTTPRRALLDTIAQIDERKLQGLILNEAAARPGNGYNYYGYASYGDRQDKLEQAG